ncbi:MAG: peptidase S41 [Clostridium sp.]
MKNTWEKKWGSDLDYLRDNLMEKHINLFAYTKKNDFLDKIDTLKASLNELDYEEIKVEISKIVASLRDAHTSLIFTGRSFLPLKFYYFEDGIYIINTTKKYENLLFKRVEKIENVGIDEVLSDLSSVISHENTQFFKGQSMKYLQIAECLYGLLIIDDVSKINITIEGNVYEIETVGIDGLEYTNEKLPLYAKRSNENIWFTILEDKKLYIKYNFCREFGEVSIYQKIKEIEGVIERERIKKITVDLRHNIGGDSRLLIPLINYLRSNDGINKRENLSVIIGRDTFSSALLNAYEFKNTTNARLVGEGSGGKPNCYGEILRLVLPNSKLTVTYSTRFYKLVEDNNLESLYPDEILLESISDYTN